MNKNIIIEKEDDILRLKFSEIDEGELFEHDGMVYIKIPTLMYDNRWCSAVPIKEGAEGISLDFFEGNTPVYPIHFNLIYEKIKKLYGEIEE